MMPGDEFGAQTWDMWASQTLTASRWSSVKVDSPAPEPGSIPEPATRLRDETGVKP
jgi:hypothetical protein